jgi:hypothetical protein
MGPPSNGQLSFPYLVQPLISEFKTRSELRLYIIDGRFLCGGKSYRFGCLFECDDK